MIEMLNESKEDQQQLTQFSQPSSESCPHRVEYITDPKTGMLHRITVLNQYHETDGGQRGEAERLHFYFGNGTTTKNASGRFMLGALAQLPKKVVITEAFRESGDPQKAIDGRRRVTKLAGFSEDDAIDLGGISKGANLAALEAQQDGDRVGRLFTIEGVCSNNKTRLHLAHGAMGVLPEVLGDSFRRNTLDASRLIDIPDDYNEEFDTAKGWALNFAKGALIGRLPIIADNPRKLHKKTGWFAFVGSNDDLGDPTETLSLTDERDTFSTTVIPKGGHYATKHINSITQEMREVFRSCAYRPPRELSIAATRESLARSAASAHFWTRSVATA